MSVVHGADAPSFELPATDGSICSLDGLLEGGIAVVVFTCNHCPYAKAWEERMLAVGRDYSGDGVGVAAINSNDAIAYPEDSFEEMCKRAVERDYPIQYAYDESQEVARAFGATKTPEVFVIDSNRSIRYSGLIDDNEDESQVSKQHLRDTLDALLAGNDIDILPTEAAGCTIKWK